MNVYLGTAKQEITPRYPVPLAGFSHRKGNFHEVKAPIYLRVFYFCNYQENGKADIAILLTADLIWWGSDLVPLLEKRIQEEFSIDSEAVIFHATHNHCGPQTSKGFTSYLGKRSEEYVEDLQQYVLNAIAAAKENAEVVYVKKASVDCEIGINRRLLADGGITMAPNPTGIKDSEVILVRFEKTTGETKAMLVHYACHPTTTGDNDVSSEFPGCATESIERYFDNSVIVGYLQGCCGDIRPALIKDGAFYRGNQEDIQRLGKSLATKVIEKVKGGRWEEIPVDRIKLDQTEIYLDFNGFPEPDKIDPAAYPEDELMKEWSSLIKETLNAILNRCIPLKLKLVTLGEISFLAMNAEMVVEYGLDIKKKFSGRVIPLPYSNGMIGYVPTAKQLEEGGYEARDSSYYFALPAVFSSAVERNIHNGIDALIQKGESVKHAE